MQIFPALRARLNSVWVAVLVTALVYGVYLRSYIHHHSGRPSYLVRVGGTFTGGRPVPGNPYVNPGVGGYDGQWFFRFALDPFNRNQTAYGLTIDAPPYRQQRILYAIMAGILALGRPRLIIATLLLINYVALCALAGLGAQYAKEKGCHALWGLLLSLTASGFVVVILDTAELVSVVFALLTLRYLDARKFLPAALWATAAALTRETTLVLPAIAVAILLLQSRRPSAGNSPALPRSLLWLALPFGVYLLWVAWLTHVWGQTPWSYSAGRFGFPLLGLLRAVRNGTIPQDYPYKPVTTFHMELLLAFAALTAYAAIRRSTASPLARTTWLVYAALGLSYGYPIIYKLDLDYLRLLTDFFVLGGFVLIAAPRHLRAAGFSLNALLCLPLILDLIHNRW